MPSSRTLNRRVGRRLLLAGVAAAVALWVIEAVLHAVIFENGGFVGSLLAPGGHEVWMRVVSVAILLALVGYAQVLVTRKSAAEALLHERQEWLETTLRSIGDAVIATDEEGRIRFMNPVAQQMTGWEFAEAESVPLTDVFKITNEMTGAVVENPLIRVLREGVVVGLANHTVLTAKDGTRYPIDDSGAPIRSDRGDVIGAVLVFHDVTEKRMSDEALQASEARFRQFFLDAPAYCYMVSRDGVILDVNDVALRALGYERNELIGKPVMSIYTAEARAKASKLFDDWRQTGLLQDEEMTLVTKSGEIRTVLLSATSMKDERGDTESSISIQMDVTDRLAAERAARMERLRAQRFLDVASVIIVALDAEGCVAMINRKGCEVLGRAEDDIVGRNWFDNFVSPSVREQIKPVAKDLFAGKVDVAGYHENPVLAEDGRERLIAWHNTIVRDEAGVITTLLCSGQDITVRKRAEEEREELKRQLLHGQKIEAIGTLAGGVAHDFNNLLVGINGLASMMKAEAEPGSRVYENAAMIEESGRRASEITKQLLSFARKEKQSRTSVDVVEILQGVIGLLQHTVDKRIVLRGPSDNVRRLVKGDRSQLEQVVMNLAVNAQHAMPEGGELRLDVRNEALDEAFCRSRAGLRPGEHVVLTVSDTGMGIPEGVGERIFEPFFTTRDVGEGTGMGLATAFGIVRGHGGTIEFDSNVGKGTEFRVYLPQQDGGQSSPHEFAAPAAVPGTGRVLVVDDERIVRYVAQQMLESLGYEVVQAEDGQQAVELFRSMKNKIDVVLLDVSMPVMDGVDCLHELRAIDPDVRVLISSGRSPEGVAKTRSLEGVSGFAQKPYDIAQLSEAIDRALGSAHGPGEG